MVYCSVRVDGVVSVRLHSCVGVEGMLVLWVNGIRALRRRVLLVWMRISGISLARVRRGRVIKCVERVRSVRCRRGAVVGHAWIGTGHCVRRRRPRRDRGGRRPLCMSGARKADPILPVGRHGAVERCASRRNLQSAGDKSWLLSPPPPGAFVAVCHPCRVRAQALDVQCGDEEARSPPGRGKQ